MLAKSIGSVVLGIDALPVEIEVDVSPGLPGFHMVGLADNAVKESRERVRAAIKNSGYSFPSQKITVNLAPADLKKDHAGLDLPIALSLLCLGKAFPQESLLDFVSCGELSLDGSVKATTGVLPIALLAKKIGKKGLICPRANAREAAVIDGLSVIGVTHLSQVAQFLNGQLELESFKQDIHKLFDARDHEGLDFAEVAGQESAKRALEVAAAGGHNVLMTGPPGSGKTMLARRLPSILPPLTFEEALETTCIYSIAGLLSSEHALMVERPFCAPHHTISDAGLIGGGSTPRPGQVSLAHNGVLFLDELPEFKRNTLESLRQPLEDGFVTIARAKYTVRFPARFTLVAAQNPCPCGYYGAEGHECTCTPGQLSRYASKVSGPVLDRIDIHIDVPAVAFDELSRARIGESSKKIRKRVIEARRIQQERFSGTKIFCNAQMGVKELKEFCKLDSSVTSFLERVCSKFHLSARVYHRILKIARTIADLDGSKDIQNKHVAEAVHYRNLDRQSLFA